MTTNLPREILVVWTCACGLGYEVSFDVAARPHSRTHQCPACQRTLEIKRPVVVDLAAPGKET